MFLNQKVVNVNRNNVKPVKVCDRLLVKVYFIWILYLFVLGMRVSVFSFCVTD